MNLELEDGFSYGEAFEGFWQVYDRQGEPCVRCGAKIRRETHGGRSTYWFRGVREGEGTVDSRGSSPTVREGVGLIIVERE